MLERMSLRLLKGYKRFISPLLPPACRFEPTCSEYMTEAIRIHGFFRGVRMGLQRLLRCHPFHSGGYDPVPLWKKKVLIAVLLSLLVLLIWGKFVQPPKPQPYSSPGKASPAVPVPAAPPAPMAPAPALPAAEKAASAAVQETIAAKAEEIDTLENEFMALTFANKGARLVSARLKKYLDYDGHPLEMVPAFAPTVFPWIRYLSKTPIFKVKPWVPCIRWKSGTFP